MSRNSQSILLLRSLELEREESSRLKRHVGDLKKAHHQSESKMSRQLKQIAKEKEDLLIRYVNTLTASNIHIYCSQMLDFWHFVDNIKFSFIH